MSGCVEHVSVLRDPQAFIRKRKLIFACFSGLERRGLNTAAALVLCATHFFSSLLSTSRSACILILPQFPQMVTNAGMLGGGIENPPSCSMGSCTVRGLVPLSSGKTQSFAPQISQFGFTLAAAKNFRTSERFI
jgi:hypothetical protein